MTADNFKISGVSPPQTSVPVSDALKLPEGGSYVRKIAGGSSADSLTGTTVNEYLDGGPGMDKMAGGKGDDTYVLGSRLDVVVEKVGEGVDTAILWDKSYSLPANLENLVVPYSGGALVKGNDLGNRLQGGSGNDVINGGKADDLLKGGSGNDTFLVQKGHGSDVILDFKAGFGAGDKVALHGFDFGSFAEIRAAMSQSGSMVQINLGSGDSLSFSDQKIVNFVTDDFLLKNSSTDWLL